MSGASVKVCIIGSRGRMGQAIAAAAKNWEGVIISAQIDAGDSIETGVKECSVAIDFSTAGAVEEICNTATKYQRALVIGTTGHSAPQRDAIESAAHSIPIVLASNFSTGVNVLFWLTGRAAKLLGKNFEPEIIETHHVMKKDAPSGTAKTLAEILKSETGRSEIPTQSIREGDVVGKHVVIFDGPGERLELVHTARSRETFATGALAAAKWVMNKPAGLYSMQDVLGLK